MNDGGPAFPVMPPIETDGQSASGYPYPSSGLSLRDWFAGMAMQGLIAASGKPDGNVYYDDGVITKSAFDMANAMLTARETK